MPSASSTPAAARPSFRELTIPAGTSLPLLLDTPVGSDSSKVEQPVRGHLSRAVTIDGVEALPEGSVISGYVTEAVRAGKTKGRARLGMKFDSVEPAGSEERYSLETSAVERIAPSEKKKDAAKIAVPAAGGAIVGGIVGGGKGAAIGAAVGGGAGTAVVMTDRGQEVRFGKGAALTVKLARPLVVRIRA